MMNLLVENLKSIRAADPKDYSSAAFAGLYVSMKNYNHIQIKILTGAWAAGTAAVTVKQATAVAGTSAKALGFSWMWTDEAADGTLVKTAVTANTFDLDTASKQYIIEIDVTTLDVANGFDCLSVLVASPGANADLYSIGYQLSGAGWKESTPPSCLID